MGRQRRSEHGATAVEYAILVSLIAVVIVVAVTVLGTETAKMYEVPCQALHGCP